MSEKIISSKKLYNADMEGKTMSQDKTENGIDVCNKSNPKDWTSLCERVGKLERNMSETMTICKRTEVNTAEIVIFFNNLKGAFTVLEWIARLAKPISILFGFGVTAWGFITAFKSGIGQK